VSTRFHVSQTMGPVPVFEQLKRASASQAVSLPRQPVLAAAKARMPTAKPNRPSIASRACTSSSAKPSTRWQPSERSRSQPPVKVAYRLNYRAYSTQATDIILGNCSWAPQISKSSVSWLFCIHHVIVSSTENLNRNGESAPIVLPGLHTMRASPEQPTEVEIDRWAGAHPLSRKRSRGSRWLLIVPENVESTAYRARRVLVFGRSRVRVASEFISSHAPAHGICAGFRPHVAEDYFYQVHLSGKLDVPSKSEGNSASAPSAEQ